MRPLELSLKGLHSYAAEQLVDFQRLGERGLFGIVGPTGAGKSTILDAITLALYGEVERADRSKRGIAHPDVDEVRVRLRFEAGAAGGEYEVERAFRPRPDGSVELKKARLRERVGGEWVTPADKAGDVNRKVQAVLGLSCEDFKRVVVLPQGKFAEFLQLAGAERRKMLGHILGLERFGDPLYREASRRLGGVRGRLQELGGASGALQHASHEALESARLDALEKKGVADEAEQAHKEVERALGDAAQVRELQLEVHRREQAQAKLVGRQATVQAQRDELDAAARAEPLRGLLAECNHLAHELIEADKSRVAAEADLRVWSDLLRDHKAQAERAAQDRERRGPELQRRRDELREAVRLQKDLEEVQASLAALSGEMALKRSGRVEALDARTRLEATRAEADRRLGELAAQADALRVDPGLRARCEAAFEALRELRAAETRCQQCERRRVEKAKETELARRQVAKADGEVRGARTRLEEHQALLAQHQARFPGDEKALREAARAEERLDRVVEAIALQESDCSRAEELAGRLERELAQIEGEKIAARKAAKAAQRRLDTARARSEALQRAHQAAALAVGLEDGEKCPVCGSASHPALASAGLAGELEAHREALEEAIRVAATAQLAVAAIEERLSSRSQALVTAREDLARRSAGLAQARARLPEARRGDPLVDLRGWREACRQDLAARERARDEWATLGEKLSKGEREAQQALSKLEAWALAGQGRAEVTAVALAEADSELEAASHEKRARLERLEEQRGELAIGEIEGERDRLAQREKRVAELDEAGRRESEGRRRLEGELQDRAGQVARLDAELALLAQQQSQADDRRRVLAGQLEAICAGAQAQHLLGQCEEMMARLQSADRDSQEALQRAVDAQARAQNRLSREQAHHEAARDSSREAEERLRQELAACRFETAQAARASLRDAARRAALADAVRVFEDELHQNAGALEACRERLAGRSMPDVAWDELTKREREADDRARQTRTEAGKREERLAKLKEDRQRLVALEDERRALAPVSDRLSRLCDLVEGRKLVEFMAEQQIEFIARDASVRLMALTHDRYELVPQTDERREATGFSVRDNHNGGLLRPVGSLSGGETFLASLSMALALSVQIQLRGEQPLRFFFLDEGFGTLDDATLDVALTALERLQREDLTVGLITHVDEIRARLPRRLVVAPAHPGVSGSTVQIEEG